MAKKKKKTTRKRSRFAKALAQAEPSNKTPLFDAGDDFDVTFLGFELLEQVPGKEEWMVAKFETDNGERQALYCMSSKALDISMREVKGLLMALTECPDLDSYQELDPEGGLLDAFLGDENEFSDHIDSYIGSRVHIRVTRGNDTRDGTDYYREHAFSPAEEEED